MDEIRDFERRRSELVGHGVWMGVYLSASRPGGNASKNAAIQYRARCYKGGTFENGRKTKYIAAGDLEWVRGCIQRGQEVARLDKAIGRLMPPTR
jgi:hypothetical protein